LTFGRRLYLLVLGLVGFAAGWWLALKLGLVQADLLARPSLSALLIGIGVGLLCVLLTFIVQKIVLFAAGFGLGALVGLLAIERFDPQWQGFEWLAVLLLALLTAFAVQGLFPIALVVLSSLLGASLVVQASGIQGPGAALLFVALLVVGLGAQTAVGKRPRPKAAA
jgi:hypothetical protein